MLRLFSSKWKEKIEKISDPGNYRRIRSISIDSILFTLNIIILDWLIPFKAQLAIIIIILFTIDW